MASRWEPAWGTRTYVMGVVNVTPNSFSGDGVGRDPGAALRKAEELAAAGADVIDVGGESTRPGYVPVELGEELERVVPAVRLIARRIAIPISVDTSKAEVARQALAAGATIVNDVSGLRDPDMAAVAARAGARLVLVHSEPAAGERDVVARVVDGLRRLVERAEAAGVERRSLLVDPGLGMGKGWRDNLHLVQRLTELRSLHRPILIGPSRKGTISRVLGVEPSDRMEGTAALVAASIAHGADVVRVHDVREMARVARMMDALVRTSSASASAAGR